jgi:bacterioferritin
MAGSRPPTDNKDIWIIPIRSTIIHFLKEGIMDITNEKLVELLNHDLELEYSAAIQYINHSAVMTGAAYGDIIKELKIHANEEIQHAMILADQIDFLGGEPTVRVGEIRTSRDNDMMLNQDLEGEEDAIRRYKVRIEQAETLKEFALAQQLRNILATEQEHAMDLKQALGR